MKHARAINREIQLAKALPKEELFSLAKRMGVPFDLLKATAEKGRLPVVNFAAGGLGENPAVVLSLISRISDCQLIRLETELFIMSSCSIRLNTNLSHNVQNLTFS